MSTVKNQQPSEQEAQVEDAENSTNLSSSQMQKVLPQKTPLQEAVENFMVNTLVKDVKITIGKQVFECHSCVLRTFCKCFEQTLLSGKAFTLPEDKISAESFLLAYNWMISSDSSCQRGNLLDLLVAAEYLDAPKLVQSVYGALNDERFFSNLDAFNCFTEACTKGISSVADLMIDRIGKSFLVFVSSDEFRELNVNVVCTLLSSDLLGVHTEVEVFYAGLLWVISDYTERKMYLRRVLRSVRFELMPPPAQLNFGDRLNEMTPYALDLLLFLLCVAIINAQERTLHNQNGIPQRHRIYIRDPLCPYLDLLENRTEELSVTMFRDYILSLENEFDEFKARIVELVAEEETDDEEENAEENENANSKEGDDDEEEMEEEQCEIDDDEEENETVEVEEEEEDIDVDMLSEETEQDAIM